LEAPALHTLGLSAAAVTSLGH